MLRMMVKWIRRHDHLISAILGAFFIIRVVDELSDWSMFRTYEMSAVLILGIILLVDGTR